MTAVTAFAVPAKFGCRTGTPGESNATITDLQKPSEAVRTHCEPAGAGQAITLNKSHESDRFAALAWTGFRGLCGTATAFGRSRRRPAYNLSLLYLRVDGSLRDFETFSAFAAMRGRLPRSGRVLGP